MAKIVNWIEEALDEIGNSAIGDREHWKQIILSHAPVIDAEKLAEKIVDKVIGNYELHTGSQFAKEIENLITDSIDLNITWKDGRAESDLDTANKRIDYLEKCNDYYEGNRRTHPSKEQTND